MILLEIKQMYKILFITLFFSNCTAKNTMNYPYELAMKHRMSDKSIFMKIVAEKKSLEYENLRIRLFGYINKSESRIYASSDFIDPLNSDNEDYKNFWSIKLFDSYQGKKLLNLSNCTGGESLVEILGVFSVEKSKEGKPISYYMTGIEKIYEFDITPINEGGKGEKHECYPELKTIDK